MPSRPDRPAAPTRAPRDPSPPPPVLDVVLPVLDEERDLERAVRRLHAYLRREVPHPARITVADNGSTDRTPQIARRLAAELDGVELVRLSERGRGRALAHVWSRSDAAVLVYMDVDLSTDLRALPPLVAPLVSGHSDLAIGSRLARGARVVRVPHREVVSRAYNLLLRGTLAARFSDAQCGFKAIRADVARELLPLVHDTGWFFDTELLVLAERARLRIHEVPVDWVDDPDSKVDVVATAVADLRGMLRIGRALATGTLPLAGLAAQFGRSPLEPAVADVPTGLTHQLVRFGAVGVASTLAYVVLYACLVQVWTPQVANAATMLLTAVGNTAANRRLTFGVRGPRSRGRHHVQGLLVFGLGLLLTSGSLWALDLASPTSSTTTQLCVLVLANLAATLLRFLLMRHWIFRSAVPAHHPPKESST